MSYFRCSLGVVSRKNGGSALRRSAYQRCAVSEGGEFDFSNKIDEYVGHEILLPDGVPEAYLDPDYLWQEAENMENRVDSTTAKTVELAIPDEVPEKLWMEFAHEMMSFYKDHGFAVEYSIHRDAGVFRNEANNHIHGMLSTRQIGEDGFSDKKDRDFEKNVMRKGKGRHLRKITADMMNDFFERHDIDAHVDPGRKEARSDVVPVMNDKSTIKEIKRHKEAAEHHVSAGGKMKDFPGVLSGKAQRFLSDVEVHKAEKQLEKAQEREKHALHSDVPDDVWNAAEAALDAYMNGELGDGETVTYDPKKASAGLDPFERLKQLEPDNPGDHLVKNFMLLQKIKTGYQELDDSIDIHDVLKSSGGFQNGQKSTLITSFMEDYGRQQKELSKSVQRFQEKHDKGETSSRDKAIGTALSNRIADSDFAMLEGDSAAALAAFMRAWSKTMKPVSRP